VRNAASGAENSEIYTLHNVQRIVDALHSLNYEVIVLGGNTEFFSCCDISLVKYLMMFGVDWGVVFFQKA